VGPVFSTPTKSGNPPLGTEILARVGSMAGNIPWLAVGGINLQNLGDMRKCGASRVALVRALRESRNPGGVIKKVKRILENRTGMEQKR
ncbi:MAG TPA: thiamine phosphate synthase, partial [bacterium]|nr:thiamine phosphate synthase [bacterium]